MPMTLTEIINDSNTKAEMKNLQNEMVTETFDFKLIKSKQGVVHFQGKGSGTKDYNTYFKFPALQGAKLDLENVTNIIKNTPVRVTCSGAEFQQRYKAYAKSKDILLNIKILRGTKTKMQENPSKALVCRHLYFLGEYLLNNPQDLVKEILLKRKSRERKIALKVPSSLSALRLSKGSKAMKNAKKMKFTQEPEILIFKQGSTTFSLRDTMSPKEVRTVLKFAKLKKRAVSTKDVENAVNKPPASKMYCTCKEYNLEYKQRAKLAGLNLPRAEVKYKQFAKWDNFKLQYTDKGVLCRHLYYILNKMSKDPQWMVDELNKKGK